ncbi:MAG: Sau3AI family type II restriction endonuclease [Patescibacteria group bacterium]|nr:Sau3AI family type II restriction endonuclease [Patescibacteria group bacterium]
MTKTYTTKKEVLTEAKKILGRSLRDVMIDDEVNIEEIEQRLVEYGRRRKGLLGELVEEFVFGLGVNNRAEADFKIAGIELKTNPLKEHSVKKYVSKERLVFSMINYDEVIYEMWETSSFLKKNKVLLLMFYLWLKEQDVLDYKFKFIHLLDLLDDISEEDIYQIQKDWEYIVGKIKRGEAHLLSEGDTYYLGACTKAANSRIVRDQPMARIPAKPRAFSFKQQYLNFLIQKELLGKGVSTESIFKKKRRLVTVEDIVKEKLQPFIGKTDIEIKKALKWDLKKEPKQWKRLLVNRMLGVRLNKIEELEKANITLKAITLEHTGTLKESLSFPAFDYKDLVTQVWYDEEEEEMSEFYVQLETKRFLFAVFQKQKDSKEVIFKKFLFWNFPVKDMSEAENVWNKTIDCITDDRYENLPKISDSEVAHVRPHGKNAEDTTETLQGTQEMKRCFWLNAKYIQKAIESTE